MIFSPTGGLNLGFIFVYHNRSGVKVFPSFFRQIERGAPDIFSIKWHRPIDFTSHMISRSSAGRRTGAFYCMMVCRGPFGYKTPVFRRWTPNRQTRVGSVKKHFFSGHKVMPSLPSILKLPWPQGTFPLTRRARSILSAGRSETFYSVAGQSISTSPWREPPRLCPAAGGAHRRSPGAAGQTGTDALSHRTWSPESWTSRPLPGGPSRMTCSAVILP